MCSWLYQNSLKKNFLPFKFFASNKLCIYISMFSVYCLYVAYRLLFYLFSLHLLCLDMSVRESKSPVPVPAPLKLQLEGKIGSIYLLLFIWLYIDRPCVYVKQRQLPYILYIVKKNLILVPANPTSVAAEVPDSTRRAAHRGIILIYYV